MTKTRLTRFATALFVFTVVFSAGAQAASLRTFVSLNGADTNTSVDCPITAPCRNLSAALGVTLAFGTVTALNTADFAPVTISQSVTIGAVPGSWMIIPVASGAGFTINAPGSANVILNNIQFMGGNAVTTGILNVAGAKVVVKNCRFLELNLGINANGKVDIIDSDFFGNNTGIRADGEGANPSDSPPVATTTMLRVSGGNFVQNGVAFHMANPGFIPSTTSNKTNIFIRTQGGTYEWTVNVAGNSGATLASSGTGCGPGNCLSLANYYHGINPR